MKSKTKREIARIRQVTPLDGFRVHLVFRDGVEKDVDLEPLLHGPIFEPMRNDPAFFRKVYVDPISETITWPNEADIDPDVLRYDLKPAWMESQAAPSGNQKSKNSARKLIPEPVERHTITLPKSDAAYLRTLDKRLSTAIRKLIAQQRTSAPK